MPPRLLAALAALLCGAASAQDAGALCRSFCDTEAHECRAPTRSAGWIAADTLLHLRGGGPVVAPDKYEQAADDADRDRRAHAKQCGDARQVCRQNCVAPAAEPVAASAAALPSAPAASATN